MTAAAASTGVTTGAPALPARWGGVIAMTVCAFALVASEFMPVSLLTPIAASLGVSEGAAGQGIAVSGAFAVVTSLLLPSIARRMDRKALLLWMTVLMLASGALIAFAPNYAVYLAGRALIGVAVGGFWSMSAAAAIRLVPADRVPRALAIVNGGNALAMVVAAPMGSYLGAVVGWRGAFFCLVPVALVSLAWQWRSLPAMRDANMTREASVMGLMRQPRVAVGVAAVSLLFMGQFTLFTYVRPFLEGVTHVGTGALPLVLLVIGVAGFVGTLLVGGLLRRGFYATLIGIPLLMAAIALSLVAGGGFMPLVVALLGVWGLAATAAPVGWWTWVAVTLPADAEAGGGLMVAAVQLAIGLGSAVGGAIYDTSGWQSTFVTSALLLMASAAFAAWTGRLRGAGGS